MCVCACVRACVCARARMNLFQVSHRKMGGTWDNGAPERDHLESSVTTKASLTKTDTADKLRGG